MGKPAVILGVSGYSGAELARLLVHHPLLQVSATSASRSLGKGLGEVQPHLIGLDLPDPVTVDKALATDPEVVFSCLPSGALEPYEESVGETLVIDLSDTHRADSTWRYGLSEFVRGGDMGNLIANPGCYPTASLLALLPFAQAGAIAGPIVIDAMSGLSGAGRNNEDRLLFATIAGGVSAYGDTRHRHVGEIERYLGVFGGLQATVTFTPHLVPMSRGVLVTARAQLMSDLDDAGALELLHARYDPEPFVHVTQSWPSTKAVTGSNRALVTARVDERASMLVCCAVIDNLGKGAAGQAVQNANLAAGVEETLGLELVGVWP